MAETYQPTQDTRKALIAARNAAQRGIPGGAKRLDRGQRPAFAHDAAPKSIARQREN